MSFAGKPPDLWNPDYPAKAADHRPVTGPMAPYVGKQYSAEEIWRFYCRYVEVYPEEEATLRPLAERIRAFDVPRLAGATFTVERLGDAAAALEALLHEQLPGITWKLVEQYKPFLGPVKKYAIFHETLEAPTDETTQEPMVIEVYGHLFQVNGQPAGRGWFQQARLANEAAEANAMIGPFVFRLQQATYANTDDPGIGVPFYE